MEENDIEQNIKHMHPSLPRGYGFTADDDAIEELGFTFKRSPITDEKRQNKPANYTGVIEDIK